MGRRPCPSPPQHSGRAARRLCRRQASTRGAAGSNIRLQNQTRVASMQSFRKKAKVVIVGLGGIVGASIAHHLIERGWDDIVGIGQVGIPTDIGSTAHASTSAYTTKPRLSLGLDRRSIRSILREDGSLTPASRSGVARTGDPVWMEEIKRSFPPPRPWHPAHYVSRGRNQKPVPADRGR